MRAARVRLTADGAAFALCTATLALAAFVSGNNLLFLLFAASLAPWIVDAALGGWNLRHLEIRRELPMDLFAERPASGALHVRNHRRWLPSAALVVRDVAGDAVARVDRVAAGAEARGRATWRLHGRGRARLDRIEVESTFPLGLWRRTRAVSRPCEIVVFPRPSTSEPARDGAADRGHGASSAGAGALGDLAGLRPYVPGDPPRRIHWPTSGRIGRPIVAVRADEVADRVVIRVRDVPGPAWELEIARACGEILRASHRGDRIELILLEERLRSTRERDGRRALLERLALAPTREGA